MRRRSLLIALIAAGCTRLPDDLAPIEARLVDLLPAKLGLLSQDITLRLSLLNPNNVGLRATGLRFDVVLDGEPFATAVSDEGVYLERLTATDAEAIARVGTGELLDRVRQAPSSNAVAYTIEGTVYLRGGREVPMTGNASLRLPSLTG